MKNSVLFFKPKLVDFRYAYLSVFLSLDYFIFFEKFLKAMTSPLCFSFIQCGCPSEKGVNKIKISLLILCILEKSFVRNLVQSLS